MEFARSLRFTQIFSESVRLETRARSTPTAAIAEAVVAIEMGCTVRDLADVWGEVPALEILQAEGLDKLTAKELFDVAAEPEWRAQVILSGLRDESNVERVLRVAQGPQSAWMALPLDEGVNQIRVETVQAGEVADRLRAYWDDVSL